MEVQKNERGSIIINMYRLWTNYKEKEEEEAELQMGTDSVQHKTKEERTKK
jgi:hypothetical protein